jgi:hypothetical protein
MGDPPLPPPESAGWTDEEWIAWLDATDEGSPDPDDASEPVRPSGAMGRIAHSGGGQVLGAAMLGMARAIFGEDPDEVQAVAEAPGEPDEDEPGLHLDAEDPSRSRYVLPPRTGGSAELPPSEDGGDSGAAPSGDPGGAGSEAAPAGDDGGGGSVGDQDGRPDPASGTG